jgi:hypothetical protein
LAHHQLVPGELSAFAPSGPAFAKIEEHGGFAEEDPWIGGGWLWIFLPPETDYDPSNNFDEVIKGIPREDIQEDYAEWRQKWGVRLDETTGSSND